MSTSSSSRTSLQMKTTASGRPFLKDMHDLFSAFVNSVNITTNRNIFKSYPHTFTAEDVINTLSHLNFTQTISHPDPQDASRVVTTTVTTTFSMTKEMARHLCGQFLEAHLIFNAADPTEKIMMLRPDGIYGLTTKGNIVYETFLRETESAVLTASNSPSTETSSRQNNYTCTTPSGTLLYLRREDDDDQLILSHSTIESIFKAFSGPTPNYTEKESIVPSPIATVSKDRVTGSVSLSLGGINYDEGPGLIGIRVKDRQQTFRKVRRAFKGAGAMDWLLTNTTALNRFEAVAIANQFIQHGYIQPVSESEKGIEILDSSQVAYQFTDEGKEVAGWNETDSNGSTTSVAEKKPPTTTKSLGTLNALGSTAEGSSVKTSKSMWGSISNIKGASESKSTGKLEPRAPVAPPSLLKEPKETKANASGSTTQRLTLVLAEPELCSLFKEFLQSMFCQENLEFYTDVVAFKKEFGKNRTADDVSSEENSNMVLRAIGIYKTYLCPGAEKELNINHTVRRDMVNYMTTLMQKVNPATGEPRPDGDSADKKDIPRLTCSVFDKIEHHIFHLMASDSLPKFVKTEAFKDEIASKHYPGLSVPPDGPLMTMSKFLESLERDDNASTTSKKRGSVISSTSSVDRKSLSPRPSLNPIDESVSVFASSRQGSKASLTPRPSEGGSVFASSRQGSKGSLSARPSSPSLLPPEGVSVFDSPRSGKRSPSPRPSSPSLQPDGGSVFDSGRTGRKSPAPRSSSPLNTLEKSPSMKRIITEG